MIYIRGIATIVEQTIITVHHMGNVLLYSLAISSGVVMKFIMRTSAIGDSLLRTKSYFIFTRLVSPKSDMNLD